MILHSKIIGESGKKIMILHGLYGNSDSWSRVANMLADDFMIYLPDLRNHGKSFDSEVHSYQEMCDDVKRFLDSKNIHQIDIVGHSMGGKLAMFFAQKHPDYVKKLVVADISPRSYKSLLEHDANVNFHLNLLSIMRSLKLDEYKDYRGLSKELITHGETVKNVILKNIGKENGSFFWKINVEALFQNINNIMDGLNPDDFIDQKINVETLFLRAKQSNYITSSDEKLIDFIFTNYKIADVENAGHWLHYDNPEDTAQIIREFVLT